MPGKDLRVVTTDDARPGPGLTNSVVTIPGQPDADRRLRPAATLDCDWIRLVPAKVHLRPAGRLAHHDRVRQPVGAIGQPASRAGLDHAQIQDLDYPRPRSRRVQPRIHAAERQVVGQPVWQWKTEERALPRRSRGARAEEHRDGGLHRGVRPPRRRHVDRLKVADGQVDPPLNVLLLDERQEQGPEPGPDRADRPGGRAGVKDLSRQWRQLTVRGLVVVHREADLLEVVLALYPVGRLANLLDGREQQADQDRDDRYDDEQLNEGEGAALQGGHDES